MAGCHAPHDGLAHALPWVVRFAALVAPGGRVLDLASGAGRHSRLFAERGCDVLAIDRDASVLASLDGVARVTTLCADLENGPWPVAGMRFDAVIVTNYLHRASLPNMLDAIADSGLLLYSTFAVGNEAYGKPANPDFLLRPDELLAVVAPRLDVVAFEQGLSEEGRPAVVQRLAAVGRARPWPRTLPP
jgi:SAM-dependent methyltransferase